MVLPLQLAQVVQLLKPLTCLQFLPAHSQEWGGDTRKQAVKQARWQKDLNPAEGPVSATLCKEEKGEHCQEFSRLLLTKLIDSDSMMVAQNPTSFTCTSAQDSPSCILIGPCQKKKKEQTCQVHHWHPIPLRQQVHTDHTWQMWKNVS